MSSALSLLPIWPPVQSTHSILTTSLFLIVPTEGTALCKRGDGYEEVFVYYLGASGSARPLAGNNNVRIPWSTCVENFLVGCWFVQVDLRGVSETFFTHLDLLG